MQHKHHNFSKFRVGYLEHHLIMSVFILTVRLIGNRTHFHTILEQLYA